MTRFLKICSALVLCACATAALSQSEEETPLGDVARASRAKQAPAKSNVVIDNDNLGQAVTALPKIKADSAPTFSIESGGDRFKMDSPDGSCSLSFNANSAALIADPVMAHEVPRAELAKIDGPATLHNDSIEVSLYNGTAWNISEITIGLTIVRHDNPEAVPGTVSHMDARPRIVPASMRSDDAGIDVVRRSDSTVLYTMKGYAAPQHTTLYREMMASALNPGDEWHWAIVSAKGVPPRVVTPLPQKKSVIPAAPLPQNLTAPESSAPSTNSSQP